MKVGGLCTEPDYSLDVGVCREEEANEISILSDIVVSAERSAVGTR